MRYPNILEEELKNKIAQEYFAIFDCTQINGRVDFCVSLKNTAPTLIETPSLLWAEAKKGSSNIYKSFIQLILTIGKERTFDKFLPPPFLAAFDAEKIAFLPYSEIQDIFYQNDFNWNVAPSNHQTKEFILIFEKVSACLETQTLFFNYEKDDAELRRFIKDNFIEGKNEVSRIQIDKNNFIAVYNKWQQTVKPTISADWDKIKSSGFIDGDFYLADLLADNNQTIKEKLFVLLKNNYYEFDRKTNDLGFSNSSMTSFNDKQKAHTQFWNRYVRPPRQEYWDYIVRRRDLLVPQDVRERKGSYFTPQIWVELSQRYLADVLGDDWQDEYYIWDCAAGTGNLLNGLTNKYNVWASTLDRQDVDVMHDRIRNGANLLESHVFQFDFLNDDFSKLPQGLQDIINNPDKRRKLVMYINPPYAEAGSVAVVGDRKNKTEVATQNNTWNKYKNQFGMAIREIFAQFLIRIFQEIPTTMIANFSKLKNLQSSAFQDFRQIFRAKLEKIFLVPADTFDNVKGQFPIAFYIWNTKQTKNFLGVFADVYELDKKNNVVIPKQQKYLHPFSSLMTITDWITKQDVKNKTKAIGYTGNNGPDFQNSNYCCIETTQKVNTNGTLNNSTKYSIHPNNIVAVLIYFTVRHCVKPTWLNDRDQFYSPNTNDWESDTDFQNDCIAYTLFHNQNRISSAEGVNHWIPFTEAEVNAKDKFASNFMSQYLRGKIKAEATADLFEQKSFVPTAPLVFSEEAQAVFDAGRELWRYYHAQDGVNVNASFYDIKAHFQGRNEQGRMNVKSKDETYNGLIAALRLSLKALALRIVPKVYAYGFLK